MSLPHTAAGIVREQVTVSHCRFYCQGAYRVLAAVGHNPSLCQPCLRDPREFALLHSANGMSKVTTAKPGVASVT
eukprot:scaffold66150_cov23-Tisochrysis_lutea.AAC.1